MFDMSWGEIMVIGGVALVVIGPKDLPKALRTVGQMTTKVRRMASEFQSQFNEAMREAELEDVRKEVEGLNRSVSTATSTAFNPLQTIRDEIKGAVETRHADTPAESWTPGQSELTLGAVQDPVGPGPLAPPPDLPAPIEGLNPDSAPLVPLPVDEPALPAPDPSMIVTGPGLEPMMETGSVQAEPARAEHRREVQAEAHDAAAATRDVPA